jgi:peptidoglycan DL-endopeptidase CwlO
VRVSRATTLRLAAAAMAAVAAGVVLSAPGAAAATSQQPVTTSCAQIGQGATGAAVKTIQTLIGATADGQFGPASAKSLKIWQQAHHITASGVVDAATWTSMPAKTARAACGQKVGGSGVAVGCTTLSNGTDGIAVAVLQKAIGTTVDGQFGPGTESALEKIQTAAKLTASGQTDQDTWHALKLLHTPVCAPAGPKLPKDYAAQQKVRKRVTKLATELEQAPGTTTNPVATAAIAFEKKQIGKPYQWGGIGPKSYDCSGLQMTSYLHAGLSLPRVAADQYASSGPTVPLNQAQAGDLLFYASDVTKATTIYHVVMYVGHGDILDAPHTGADVAIQPLWTTDLLPRAVRPVAALTLPVKSGASGYTVSQLQQDLNRHGAQLTVDGGFGASTAKAVKTWQAKKQLKANGVVDVDTWLTLG